MFKEELFYIFVSNNLLGAYDISLALFVGERLAPPAISS